MGTVGIAWGIYALSFSVTSVALLGSTAPVKFKVTKGGITVDLPDLPEELLAQPAWVLKLSK